MDDPHLATLLAQIDGTGGAVTPPIVQTSLFTFPDYASFEARLSGATTGDIYSRVTNPTVAAFETLIAQAEGAEQAVGFASGMGAIAATVLAFLKPGDRLACVTHVYPDAYRLFERVLRPFGIDVTYHSPNDFETQPNLLNGARMAYLESPSSVLFETMDLAQVSAHARTHNCLTVIDNSWATPLLQRPLKHGIDMVLHSASKYISGHSDTVAGVVVGATCHMGALRGLTLPLLGAKLAPFEAFLLTRGLRTLAARMAWHRTTADLFVKRLAEIPQVRHVFSPQINGKRSGLLSVEFDETCDIPQFCDALKLFHIGVSWGGFESLVMPARAAMAGADPYNAMARFGVSPQLVRLSLGLEDPEDLWHDFANAVSKA